MKRPYRIITGPAYPLKLKEDRTPENSKVNKSIDNKHDYYHSDAVRLSRRDISKFKGKPIRVEHEEDLSVGEITDTWVGKDGDMWMTSRVYTDTKTGQKVMECVDNGDFMGLSVGIQPVPDESGDYVTDMDVEEISICHKGYYDGARIAIAASDKTNYKNANRVFIKIRAMAEEKIADPTKVADPDKTEIARAHDEAVQQLSKVQKELAELKAYKEAEEQRKIQEQKAYEEKQQAELSDTLALLLENAKADRGEDATVSEVQQNVVRNAYLDPQNAPFAAEIRASALASKKNREERKQLEAQYASIKQEREMTMAQIQASNARAKVFGVTEPASSTETKQELPPVHASGSDQVKSLFESALSEYDRAIFQRDYPAFLGANNGLPGIKASATETISRIPQARTHSHVEYCPNSYRVLSPQHAKLFDFLNTVDSLHVPRPAEWGGITVTEDRYDP